MSDEEFGVFAHWLIELEASDSFEEMRQNGELFGGSVGVHLFILSAGHHQKPVGLGSQLLQRDLDLFSLAGVLRQGDGIGRARR